MSFYDEGHGDVSLGKDEGEIIVEGKRPHDVYILPGTAVTRAEKAAVASSLWALAATLQGMSNELQNDQSWYTFLTSNPGERWAQASALNEQADHLIAAGNAIQRDPPKLDYHLLRPIQSTRAVRSGPLAPVYQASERIAAMAFTMVDVQEREWGSLLVGAHPRSASYAASWRDLAARVSDWIRATKLVASRPFRSG